tara:strand:- start:170 stop:370 length:201 start_codon:yes stop_codon:yes gene_type:complete
MMEAETNEVEPTPENRERLARAVVESMDSDDLEKLVVQTFFGIYGQMPLADFQREWNFYVDEEEGE